MDAKAQGAGAALPRLDGLDQAGLDALAIAIVQIASDGWVTACNAEHARMFGASREAIVGRDFFRDVAPATNLPAFRGRFLDGIRRGAVDERFRFVFGLDPRPVRAEVHIIEAEAPGRYWIAIVPLEDVEPGPHRAAARAAAAVGSRMRAEPVDPNVCELEPIHIPGSIQPHALMLAADPDDSDLIVTACSDNTSDAFEDRSPADLLGRPLGDLLPTKLMAILKAALAAGRLNDPARPLRTSARLMHRNSHERAFVVAAHLHDRRLIVELELTSERPEDFDGATALDAQHAMSRVRGASTLGAAAAVAAFEIRAMTRFERVLVYRFDAEWNGEAIAESQIDGWDQSLLGLRFPASDIPAQARALYTRSPSRFVVDRDAVPSSLVAEPQAANQAVDLTFAHARALSPIHLEYQRNLGVNGSMSVSIVVDGKLWGLVIGHHRQPHYVTPETRALTTVVSDALALRVHELESVRLWREQQATLATQNRLLEQMAGSDDFVSAITSVEAGATMLDLFAAGGAAVVSGERISTTGDTPAFDSILPIAAWLRAHLPPDKRVFATDQLSEHYADAVGMEKIASGLLAAFVADGLETRDHVLLWFRPEMASTVVWGGDPNKPIMADSMTRTVLPRRSFERWVEQRRGRAEAWATWQEGAARALTAAIEGVILRQGRQISELKAKQEALSRALEQKDVLAREVDHRVKNSLQMVGGMMLMQARAVADPTAKAAIEDSYARVMSVARVHESLHQSDDVESADLGLTLRKLCDDLAAGMTGDRRRLSVDIEPGLMVSSQTAVALSLIATELVTNALKYAYGADEPGEVEVLVRSRPGGGVELRVADRGRGLPEGWSDAAGATAGKGSLGMRVIRAMLQQIGAEMTVSDGDPGATFTVTA